MPDFHEPTLSTLSLEGNDGDAVEVLDEDLDRMKRELVYARRKYGAGADGAKASLQLTVSFSAVDPGGEDEAVTVKTACKLSLPSRPATRRTAFTESSRGRASLQMRALPSGDAEGQTYIPGHQVLTEPPASRDSLPITLEQLEEGKFSANVDDALRSVASAISEHMLTNGARAEGAKAHVKVSVSMTLTDARRDQDVDVETDIETKLPGRPKCSRGAYIESAENGAHMLRFRVPRGERTLFDSAVTSDSDNAGE